MHRTSIQLIFNNYQFRINRLKKPHLPRPGQKKLKPNSPQLVVTGVLVGALVGIFIGAITGTGTGSLMIVTGATSGTGTGTGGDTGGETGDTGGETGVTGGVTVEQLVGNQEPHRYCGWTINSYQTLAPSFHYHRD